MRLIRRILDHERFRSRLRAGARLFCAFFKWILAGAAVGAVGGGVGVAFRYVAGAAENLRGAHAWLVWLLPVGGVVTALLYHKSKVKFSVDVVLISVRSSNGVPLLMAPLIFVGTAITHLFGGSAGKEGAALQMGGVIGYQLARLFRFDEKDSHILVMCGMSALLSAVFLTPLASAIFAIEVIGVGVFYFAALVPCLTASLTAYGLARLWGAVPIAFPSFAVPALGIGPVLLIALLGIFCAAVSILFCTAVHFASSAAQNHLKNDYLRTVVGCLALVGLTLAVGCFDYNGAGMELVVGAVGGWTRPWAFLFKILFTAVTVASGLRGGEIVPTMAVGAAFGCLFGTLVGLDAGFCAAVGVASLFCAAVNCPISAIFFGLELFGAEGILFYAVACCVSFVLSGNYSLYSGQKVIYSKIKAAFVNANAHH